MSWRVFCGEPRKFVSGVKFVVSTTSVSPSNLAVE
jgi:hypothetical protein